ncbi:hypothetical protein SESBI_45129, partial [Sesbania bispinosa]
DEVLVEELHRLSCENKKLSETLSHMCENYQAMQKQLTQLINKNFEHPTRKRKAEGENCSVNMIGIRGNINTECSTITITEDEPLIKRPNITSPKVSKVLVKTEASNTSL